MLWRWINNIDGLVIVQEIEMASSQLNSAINWEASNLEEEWKNFEEHVKLMFMGPLEKTKEATGT